MALVATWKQNLADWERDGVLLFHPLDQNRTDQAADVAIRYRSRSLGCVFAGLSEELGIPLKTFGEEILDRFPQASR